MLVFRTLAAVIGSPWREVAISAISAGLILFGIGVAINHNGLANRTATVVVGNPDRNPVRPSPRTDRYWGVLPVTLGLIGLFHFLPDVPVVTFIGLPLVVPAPPGTGILVHAGGRDSRISLFRLCPPAFLHRGFRPVRLAGFRRRDV